MTDRTDDPGSDDTADLVSLDAHAVSQTLGMGESKIYEWHRQGRLPPAVGSSPLRWSRADIDNWLESQRVTPTRTRSASPRWRRGPAAPRR